MIDWEKIAKAYHVLSDVRGKLDAIMKTLDSIDDKLDTATTLIDEAVDCLDVCSAANNLLRLLEHRGLMDSYNTLFNELKKLIEEECEK